MKTLAIVSFLVLVGPAQAGEIELNLGAGGGTSTWPSDPIPFSYLRVGYRFADLFSIDYSGRTGYGPVDERVINELSLGATIFGRLGRVRPTLRLALVHQHEEPIPSIEADPWASLFGTGDGIRHRYGGAIQGGVEVPFRRKTGSRWQWNAGAHLAAAFFADERGPERYVYGGLSVGVNYDL
jgi:hypothetical protein